VNRGFIKLWRKALDAGWIKNHKLWAFWTWALLKATHREHSVIVGLQTVKLSPGQFIFGRKKASEETGLTEREIRTILDYLKKSGNLTIKTTNKFSVITIVNWDIYQGGDQQNDQQNDQQMSNKGPHTRTEEHNKIKETQTGFELSPTEKLPPGFDQIPDLTVRDSLVEICKEISKPNPDGETTFLRAYQFVNLSLKNNLRPDAILFALEQLRDIGPVKSPWPYAQHIAEVQSKNLNEADAIAKHEALKKEKPLAALLDSRALRMVK